MNEIFYLEPDDDITSVISRMKESEATLIGLVVPRGGTIAQSIINLKILKREADNLKKEVSLVTKDKISKNLASQVGMTAYSTAEEAKAARPNPKPTKPAASTPPPEGIKVNRYNREEDVGPIEDITSRAESRVDENKASDPEPEAEPKAKAPALEKPVIKRPEKPTRPEKPKKKKKAGSKKKAIIVIGIVLIIAALVLAYIFAPYATATVILTSSDLESTDEINVDKKSKKADEEGFSIPGQEVEVEKELTKEYNASGTKDVGEKTKAEITFYNDYDINPQIIAAGTTLVARGLNFTLDETISVPGANVVSLTPLQTTPGTILGKITAANPGAEYNIESSNFVISSFSGSKKEKIYGQSSSALAGGTSKKVTVISNDDMENAKSSIQIELEEAAKNSVLEKAGEGNKLITSTLRSEENSLGSSSNVDDEAATFTLTKKVTIKVITFEEAELREMIIAKNRANLGEEQTIINSEDAEITYEVTSFDEELGVVKFVAKFSGKVGKKLNEDELRNQITNKKYGEAVNTIKSMEGVENVELDVWPTILTRTPFIKQRIKIEFGYAE